MGIVLPVGVDSERVFVAGAAGELEPGLNRAADPQVERVADNESAGPPGFPRGRVQRSVVDDQNVRFGQGAPSATDDVANAQVLVERGYDQEEGVPPPGWTGGWRLGRHPRHQLVLLGPSSRSYG